MGAAAPVHPSDRTLRSFGLGKLDDASAESVSDHLERCTDCRRRVTELSSDSFLGRLREAQAPPDSTADPAAKTEKLSLDSGPAFSSSSPVSSTTLPPDLASHADYDVVRELGRGGMGVVYLVFNRLMGRHEALKVMSRQLVERPGVLERFLREIRSVAKLRHPNVVAAYSATRLGESIVYAMEYVEGIDLAKLVKTKGPLPVTHACYFASQAALGLQHAHERGIVHRDIKPGNLILDQGGERATVKVLDFGLNKASSDHGIDTSLTREGQMLGTPDYIAPEQTLNAQSVDIRADIYSLGCTLYYLLTGGPPFQAATLYEVLRAHHDTQAKPLNLVRPDVPAELADVVAKMMAKNPRDRFQTPGEVSRALVPFFKKGKVVPTSAKPELSVGGQAVPNQARANAGASPTERSAQNTPASAVPAKQTQPSRPDSSWEGLIAIDESESSLETVPALTESSRTSPGLVLAVVAGVVMFAVIGAWATGMLSPKPQDTAGVDRTTGGGQLRGSDPGASTAFHQHDSFSQAAASSSLEATAESSAPQRPNPPVTRRSEPSPADLVAKPAAADVASSSRPLERTKGDHNPEPASVDVRLIRSQLIERLPGANVFHPRGGFWPSLASDDLRNWQVGDPDNLAMNDEAVFLEAGSNGNLLLTRDASYRRCTLDVSLAARPGTDAYFALQARRGPGGNWQALTLRVYEQGGKVRVGAPATGFQTLEAGAGVKDFAPDKPFWITFRVSEKHEASVTFKGSRTAPAPLRLAPADEGAGAAGVFVKAGRLMIEKLRVQAE